MKINKYFSFDEVAKIVCIATGKPYTECLAIVQDVRDSENIKGILIPLPYDKNGWIKFNEQPPVERSEFLVAVQQIRGGLIRNNKYITIARYEPTMTDREHFEFKGEGIVTHWTPMPELPKD